MILDAEEAIIEPPKLLTSFNLEELMESTQRARNIILSRDRTKREQSSTRVPAYIAAMLSPARFNNGFVVGDGEEYGDYENYPLGSDKHYLVAVALMQGQVRTVCAIA